MVLDVMMPFYGRFDHFKLAVESVLAQTNPNWRLVIVDDVYPDPEPGRWAAALDDPRITYIRNETNLGVSGNFRRCADLMTNEFGVLMGCDDIMLPDFVDRITTILTEFPDSDLVQPGVEVIDADGAASLPLADRVKAIYRGKPRGAHQRSGEELATSLLRGNWAYFPSVVWRAALIREIGFRLDLNVVQDLAMMMEIVKRGGKMLVDDEVVFQYRRHAASVSAVGGPDGSKFIEERSVFYSTSRDLHRMGWNKGARVARHYTSSRLHALADLPQAIRQSSPHSRSVIIRHILGLRYPAA